MEKNNHNGHKNTFPLVTIETYILKAFSAYIEQLYESLFPISLFLFVSSEAARALSQ